MKNSSTLVLFAFFLMFFQGLNSQNFSPPEPFSQGQSNKANAFLGYGYDFDFLLLWEQSTDTLSTSIYYQRYLSGEEPELLISEPNVHFKNPVICNFGYGNYDTTFAVLFEKVFEDHSEIQYIKFAKDGGHSSPILLSVGGTENNLISRLGMYWITPVNVAWNSDGHLLSSRFIGDEGYYTPSEPDTIFSGEILDIKFKDVDLFWITRDTNASRIMRSHFTFQNGWSEPEETYAAKDIGALRGANHFADDLILAFSYTNDESWHINNYSYWYGNSWFYPLEISSNEAFDFDVFSTFYGVDGDLQIYHLAYVDDTLGAREIFINQWEWGYGDFSQLSYLGTSCRNPKFYLGENEYNYGNWCYLIFEAFVDGYWQLYYSRAPFTWGGIGENTQIEGVSISPNPATDFIRIQNENSSELSIEIFDMTGKRVCQDAFNQIENEIRTAGWKRGVYFVNIKQENKMITRKLVLF